MFYIFYIRHSQSLDTDRPSFSHAGVELILKSELILIVSVCKICQKWILNGYIVQATDIVLMEHAKGQIVLSLKTNSPVYIVSANNLF